MERVTVLLTVYNRKSVSDTIESILNQSYSDFKLLIIDNASTDGTYELIRKYEEKDSRICVIRNSENRGQIYSLNLGLSLSDSEYIARIDADDLMLPQRLEKQIEFLDKNPHSVICGSWYQTISDDNKLFLKKTPACSNEAIRLLLPIMSPFCHPSVMIRSSVIKKNNIKYNESFEIAADYNFWIELLNFGDGYNLPEVLLYYRVGLSNDSYIKKEITKKETFYIREKLIEGLQDSNKKRILQEIIQIEEKINKTLRDFFFLRKTYMKYVKDCNIDHSNFDLVVKLINKHIKSNCFLDNSAMWANASKYIYKQFRRILYKA